VKVNNSTHINTRGSVGWACVAHLSFCFEETVYRTFHGASYQVLVHLAKQFQRRIFFRNRPIRNKNCLWWPCLLTDRKLMSHLYRGPSMDASYQDSVHFVKQFQRRRFFLNWPIRNKNCLWWPCLLMDLN
jgi:hypothetical protein